MKKAISYRKVTKEFFDCSTCGDTTKNKYYLRNPRFCSRKCSSIAQTKNRRSCLYCGLSFIPSTTRNGMGRFCSMQCSGNYQKKHNLRRDENHPGWKGDDVGYPGIHKWIQKNLGKPTECERCGKSGLTGKQIHWANKYHTYKRNLADWLRLCADCHTKYDIEMKLRVVGDINFNKRIKQST